MERRQKTLEDFLLRLNAKNVDSRRKNEMHQQTSKSYKINEQTSPSDLRATFNNQLKIKQIDRTQRENSIRQTFRNTTDQQKI